MTAALDIQSQASDLAAALSGETFGTTTIVSAEAEVEEDSEDQLAAYLMLTLSDPADGTWPYKDVLAIRHKVLDLAASYGLQVSIYVQVAPTTDTPQQDDDQRLFGT